MDYLAERFPYHKRLEWEARLASGLVLIDDALPSPMTALRPGMRMQYEVRDYGEPVVPLNFKELRATGNLALVHKPAGLPVHRTGKIFVHTLVNLYRQLKQDSGWAPLNRLDVETSGIVAFARGPEASRDYSPANSRWRKHYLAVAHGRMEQPGEIDCALKERPDDPIRTRMHRDPAGKPARTQYQPLAHSDTATLLWVHPITGRKHQIRAHLASAGHPVVGDKVYSEDGRYYLKRMEGDLDEKDEGMLGAPHQLLHACLLEIKAPDGSGIQAFDDGVPEPFYRYFPGLNSVMMAAISASRTS